MRKSICLALFTALMVASPRAHAVTVTGNLVKSETIAATGDLGTDDITPGTLLDVYLISISSDSADALTAFDLVFTGSFAQVQNVGLGGSTPTPLAIDVASFPASGIAQDTHFLPALTLPGAPEPPPTEPAYTGMTGVFTGFGEGLVSNKVAIAASDQAPSVVIAQIVMLAGDTGSFSGNVAVAGISTPIEISGDIGIVPEPGTLALAGMGLIGVFISRRRRS